MFLFDKVTTSGDEVRLHFQPAGGGSPISILLAHPEHGVRLAVELVQSLVAVGQYRMTPVAFLIQGLDVMFDCEEQINGQAVPGVFVEGQERPRDDAGRG